MLVHLLPHVLCDSPANTRLGHASGIAWFLLKVSTFSAIRLTRDQQRTGPLCFHSQLEDRIQCAKVEAAECRVREEFCRIVCHSLIHIEQAHVAGLELHRTGHRGARSLLHCLTDHPWMSEWRLLERNFNRWSRCAQILRTQISTPIHGPWHHGLEISTTLSQRWVDVAERLQKTHCLVDCISNFIVVKILHQMTPRSDGKERGESRKYD